MTLRHWLQVSLTAAATAAACLPAATLAQTAYPTRPVRLITGSPGSTSDISARFIAQKLGERWGQQVVIENAGGAGGMTGANRVAKAAPACALHLEQFDQTVAADHTQAVACVVFHVAPPADAVRPIS